MQANYTAKVKFKDVRESPKSHHSVGFPSWNLIQSRISPRKFHPSVEFPPEILSRVGFSPVNLNPL